MPDVQADRVIDRILTERQKAQDFAAQQEGQQIVERSDAAVATVEEKSFKPARRSDILKIIDEKGEVSPEDLQKLIAKNARRGI